MFLRDLSVLPKKKKDLLSLNAQPSYERGTSSRLKQLLHYELNINSMDYGTRRFNAAFTRALQ